MNGIEQILKEKKLYAGKTQGDSMQPMLCEGDTVMIVPPSFPLKKYDVPVYRRDGHYTMHRIVKITKKGYVICGDNRTRRERDITDRDIVGVLSAFYHNGSFISCSDEAYRKQVKKICRTWHLRMLKNKFFQLQKVMKIKGK